MAKHKGPERPANNKSSARSPRLESISRNTSQIVKDAAVLLDQEVAAGIVAAHRMQQRFQKERRIAPADFQDALQKFQADAHDVISLLNDQISEMRSEENVQLAKRLVSRTHDVVDLAVELVNTGAEVASQLAQITTSRRNQGNAKPSAKRRR